MKLEDKASIQVHVQEMHIKIIHHSCPYSKIFALALKPPFLKQHWHCNCKDTWFLSSTGKVPSQRKKERNKNQRRSFTAIVSFLWHLLGDLMWYSLVLLYCLLKHFPHHDSSPEETSSLSSSNFVSMDKTFQSFLSVQIYMFSQCESVPNNSGEQQSLFFY